EMPDWCAMSCRQPSSYTSCASGIFAHGAKRHASTVRALSRVVGVQAGERDCSAWAGRSVLGEDTYTTVGQHGHCGVTGLARTHDRAVGPRFPVVAAESYGQVHAVAGTGGIAEQ